MVCLDDLYFSNDGMTNNICRLEAFDAPSTSGKSLEGKWGVMDTERNLKPGLKIPDCGGKTAL